MSASTSDPPPFRFTTPEPTIAGQARQAVAELAHAARSGPIGAATVLSYTARLSKLLTTLAAYEGACDEEAAEALDADRARRAAIADGTVLRFPTRPRLYTGGGGHAA